MKDEIGRLYGETFEHFCMEKVVNSNKFIIKDIGKWWDKKGEIDILIQKDNNNFGIIECKINPNSITRKQLDNIKETSLRINVLKDKKLNTI